SLWYLYVVAGLQAGLSGVNSPTRSAAIPNLVSRQQLPAALALNQVMFNTTLIVGPAVGGVILARLGLAWAYGLDVLTFSASVVAAVMVRPLPPTRGEGEASKGWGAVREGFCCLGGRRVLISTFVFGTHAIVLGSVRTESQSLAM